MNTSSGVSNKAVEAPTRPFFWSLRREVWENHSLYLAPIAVAIVVLFGSMINCYHLAERRQTALLLPPAARQAAIEVQYDIAALVIMMTTFFVAIFYCLDALHGERRERSILFWKSLPVSDLTTVLSKATTALVTLQLIIIPIILATQLIMMLMSTVALAPSGLAGTTWANLNFFRLTYLLLYSVLVTTIWDAPIYCWMLLVSSWARRAPFLWAVMPPLALGIFEKIAFGTLHTLDLLKYRLFGMSHLAFSYQKPETLIQGSFIHLTPGNFFSSLDVWLGLAFAAACLVIAVRLRRYRGPL